jgi:hypothetical protein
MQPFEVTTASQEGAKNYSNYRRFVTSKHLAMASVPVVTAAFFLWTAGKSNTIDRKPAYCSSAIDSSLKTATAISMTSSNDRTYDTLADWYFHKHKKIPIPAVVHATLSDLVHRDASATISTSGAPSSIEPFDNENCREETATKRNIFVIGDVHGCYEELLELHQKAKEENGSPFKHVILVGDLCNKGPESAKVIRHVRVTPDWYTVRGNHDDGALAAALGDTKKREKSKYEWIKRSEKDVSEVALSDEDITWLSELPYTITIPAEYLGQDEDTIIVHAGLVPGVELKHQEIDTMITLRDLKVKCHDDGSFSHYKPHEKSKKDAKVAENPDDAKSCDERVTWASAWFGPKQRVIFGHNAKRRLQIYPGNWAIGLDTGAVYGGGLTGIILPERKLVSVKTKEYSKVETNGEGCDKNR